MRRGVAVLSIFALVVTSVLAGCSSSSRQKQGPPPDVNAKPVRVDLEHRVGPGETLAAIATWYTGNPKNWEAIRAANAGLNPQRLRLGQLVIIPGDMIIRREPLPRSFMKERAAKTVKKEIPESVRPGDTTTPTGGIDAVGSEPVERPADLNAGRERQVEDDFAKELAKPTEVEKPSVDELLGEPKVPSEPPPVDEVAGKPAEKAPADSGKPAGGSDAEREKLLDELLSQ